MQLPEQIIENIQRDVRLYENFLQRVSHELIARSITNYPIFVAHREPQIDLGKTIIDAETMHTEWSINASLLEEFTAKNIVQSHKLANFKEVYKDPKQYACIFIISGNNDAGFAFYPYSQTT